MKYIEAPIYRINSNIWHLKCLGVQVEGASIEEASAKVKEALCQVQGCEQIECLIEDMGAGRYACQMSNAEVLLERILELEPTCKRPAILKKDRHGLLALPTPEEVINYGYPEGSNETKS